MGEALQVSKRTALGKSRARKLRAHGLVPGVVYAKGRETVPVQIDAKMLRGSIEESGRVLDMVLEGSSLKVLVKEMQLDTLSDEVLHVDLQVVSLTEKIALSVPVVLHGEPSFPSDQGTVELVLNELEVECFPQDAPEEVGIDVTELQPGDSVHVREIELPWKVTMVTSGEEVVLTVVRPTVEEEEAPPEEPVEAEEPEVISKKKEEEGGEASR